MRFRDRVDAGERLAERLLEFRGQSPVIAGIPRGGVVVAAPIARRLGGQLAVISVKKVATATHPELAVGAVAVDGTRVVNAEAVRLLEIPDAELQDAILAALREALRRNDAYDCPLPPDAARRPVIVVDDGLATGYTAVAAVRYARNRGLSRVMAAIPVAARSSVDLLRVECQRVVTLTCPDDLESVGQWYDDFSPVTDEQVLGLLRLAGG